MTSGPDYTLTLITERIIPYESLLSIAIEL